MPVPVQVRGADQLAALSRRLKGAANGKELRKVMVRELREAAKPVVAEQKRRVRSLQGAPQEWKAAAAKSTKVKVRTTGERAGVRITAGAARVAARAMNRGHWRHPTFGHEPWVDQRVEPGWFDEPPVEAAAQVRGRVFAAMTTAVQQIVEE